MSSKNLSWQEVLVERSGLRIKNITLILGKRVSENVWYYQYMIEIVETKLRYL